MKIVDSRPINRSSPYQNSAQNEIMSKLVMRLLFSMPKFVLNAMGGSVVRQIDGIQLDPALRVILNGIPADGIGDAVNAGASAAEIRAQMREASLQRSLSRNLPSPPDMQDHQVAVGESSIRLREYQPLNYDPAQGAMLFIHGGGWVIFDIDVYDEFCQDLAASTGMRLFSVDYRLAPEYCFPTPLEDCLKAYEKVCQITGLHPKDVAVAGDSAGGNLCAALSLSRMAENQPLSGMQVLIYPAVDASREHPTINKFGDGLLLTKNAMRFFWEQYVNGNDELRKNPLVSPTLAKDDDLRRMPPTIVVTAGFDPLQGEGLRFGKQLESLSVAVDRMRWENCVHGIVTMSLLPTVERCLAELYALINQKWASRPVNKS